MVNIKKVSAVATGALFVGATVGMAAAVSVPDNLQASMLAQNGNAKAELVVGKNAPGKAADTASAEVIQEAVADKLAVSAGGDLSISYGDEDLDDDGTNDPFMNETTWSEDPSTENPDEVRLTKIGDGNYAKFNNSISLKYDADGNGDLDDDDDYALYNRVYVYDAITNDIKLVYRPGFSSVGDIEKIRGTKYIYTDDPDDDEMKLAPAIEKKAIDASGIDSDSAVTISGNLKVGYDVINATTNSANVYFYEGNSYLDTINITGSNAFAKFADGDLPDAFSGYKIWYKGESDTDSDTTAGDDVLQLKLAEKAQEQKITDGQSGVLGYGQAKVDTTVSPVLELQSGIISLTRGETTDIADTYYQINFDDKELDIQRQAEEGVASGSKLDKDDYDFLSDDITVSTAAGDVNIVYGDEDLDDDGTNDPFNTTGFDDPTADPDEPRLTEIGDGNYAKFNNSISLKYDADGNGDLDDDDDYALYNRVYVYDAITNDIKLVYDPGFSSIGEVKKIRGTKYIYTDDPDDDEMKIAPAIEKKAIDASGIDADSAVTISDDLKVGYDVLNAGANTANVYFYEGNSYLDTINITGSNTFAKFDDDLLPDAFSGYKIWYKGESDTNSSTTAGDDVLNLKLAEKAQEQKITDGQSGVLGYGQAKVDTTTYGLRLQSGIISLTRDETTDVPDTYYQINFDDKELDIQRQAEKNVASGSKLDKDDYYDFLTKDVTMTATGGEAKSPHLEIVNEDTASSDMNHVLVGGPVANGHVASIVEAGNSDIDWHESEGDIEVIEGHPASGKYGIIVAGKDRDATREAADALAAWL